ncbi:putative PDZ domain-containing protein [Plasmopara halstedii]
MAHQQQEHTTAASSSRSSPLLSRSSDPQLIGDTVVFSHTKLPSRQSGVVAGTTSSYQQSVVASFGKHELQPQYRKFRVEAPLGEGVRRMKVCVIKHGEKLGFGARHDRYKRLQVSTLQGSDSKLQIGDTLLSVNGADLTGLEFESVIELLNSTQPGELIFEIERVGTGNHNLNGPFVDPRIQNASVSVRHMWNAANNAATTSGLKQTLWPQNEPTVPSRRLLAGYPLTTIMPPTGIPPSSIPVASSTTQQPRKRTRPAQCVLDNNGQPVNISVLLTELAREKTQKATIEEKNTVLRKRLQRMLIENDAARAQASEKLKAEQEKADRKLAEVQDKLVAIQAQVRLQDRAPDLGRANSIENELTACKAQIERLKKTEADRTELLATKYRTECRIASVDTKRVMNRIVDIFQSKLRQNTRLRRDNSDKDELEVACDGVRRLVFMNIFKMKHDFGFYTSASFHSQDPVQLTLEQQEFANVFGNSLIHEERAGLLYVATAPMHVVFDPNTESVILKCQRAEENALSDLARNYRS